MGYKENPYYAPGDHGLVRIGEDLDLSEPFYSFDLLAVWKDDAGFYLGTDSGCSCPSPFENYEGKGDMTGPLTAEQAIEETRSLAGPNPYDRDGLNALVTAIEAAA